MTEDELGVRRWLTDLYDLCDWLERRPGQHAYQASIRPALRYLLSDGNLSGLCIYHNDWGWRLRNGWAVAWSYLVAQYTDPPIGGLLLW